MSVVDVNFAAEFARLGRDLAMRPDVRRRFDELLPGLADLNLYVRQLEDAALVLWGELPIDECRALDAETPDLVEFLRHLHHSIQHEQATVRISVWAHR